MIKKNLSPDVKSGSTPSDVPMDNSSVNYARFIPIKIDDVVDVAKRVNESWKNNKWFTLQYITPADFDKNVVALSASVTKGKKAGSNQGSDAVEIETLDASIAEATSKNGIKADLGKKFKKNDIAQYGRYGMVKVGSQYSLPKDREKRLESMKLIPQALADDGLNTIEYGVTFWNKIIKDYAAALNKQKTNLETRSSSVGQKDVTIDLVKKVFQSMLYVLKGNFPDSYESVYREWGFRKTGQ